MIHLVPGWKLLCRAFLSELLYLLPFGPGQLTDFSRDVSSPRETSLQQRFRMFRSTGVIKGGWGKFPKSMEVYRWIFKDMEVKRWIFPSMFDDTGRLEATCWWLQHVAGTHSTWLRWTATRSWGYPVQDWPWADWGARQGARAKNGLSSHHHVSLWVDISWSIVHMCQLLRCSCFFMWYVSCYWTIASTFTSFCRWFYRKFLSCCWHIWVLFNFECNTPYVLPQWELVGLDTRSGTFSNLDMLMGQNWGFKGAVEGWSFSGQKKPSGCMILSCTQYATSRY